MSNSTKPYQLEEINCYNLNELSVAMAQYWETAKFDLNDEDFILAWVRTECPQNDLRFVKQLIQNNNLTLDQKVLAFIGKYAPELPLIWKSQVLNQDNVLILCNQALKQDKNSLDLIIDIHQQQLFDFYAQYSKNQVYADWHSELVQIIKNYEYLWTLLPDDLKNKKPDLNTVLPMIIQLTIGIIEYEVELPEKLMQIESMQLFFNENDSKVKALIEFILQNDFDSFIQKHIFNDIFYNNLNHAKEQDRIDKQNLTFNGVEYKTISEANEARIKLTRLANIQQWLKSLEKSQNYSIRELRYLKKLVLGMNQLTNLPESIRGLKNLRVLVLRENQLTSLPEWLGELKNLQTLDLGLNELASLPASIGELKNLKKLSIDKAVTIPESLRQLEASGQLNIIN